MNFVFLPSSLYHKNTKYPDSHHNIQMAVYFVEMLHMIRNDFSICGHTHARHVCHALIANNICNNVFPIKSFRPTIFGAHITYITIHIIYYDIDRLGSIHEVDRFKVSAIISKGYHCTSINTINRVVYRPLSKPNK